MIETNKIYHGNCIELMKEIPDSSIDLILTDPPYDLQKSFIIVRNGGKYGKAKTINPNFDWDNKVDYIWINECYRVLKEFGVFIVFYNMRYIQSIIEYGESLDFYLRQVCGWHKSNPVPQVRKVKWASALELFIIMTKGKGKHTFNWELGYKHNVLESPICMGNERTEHETQKPIKIFKEIIEYWSKENDIVLDPFIGSGTTAATCIRTNRNFIGIEINEKYYNIAKKRIDKEMELKFSQLSLKL